MIHDAAIANQFYQEFHQRMQDNGITLQVESNKDDHQFHLFPVPADHSLKIHADGLPSLFGLYNMQGQHLASIPVPASGTILNTSFLREGMYVLTDGKRSRKFMVRHCE